MTVEKRVVMNNQEMELALKRIALQILEKKSSPDMTIRQHYAHSSAIFCCQVV